MAIWTGSELWLYGGIAVMILAAALGGIFAVVFTASGRKIKKKLEQEYGKPRRAL